MTARFCKECAIDISSMGNRALFCRSCSMNRMNIRVNKSKQYGSYAIVKVAVECGILPKLTESTKCVDCGEKATVYEHRDYMKPLDIDFTCQSCNVKRGAGLNAA